MLGHDGEEEITYAAVIELIHTASLIHDDIIDHATLRRGAPTVNRLWGNSRPVLLGDWIYTTAMKMALSHDNLEVIRRLCSATLRMVEGELLTLERLGSVDLSVEEYFEIIERKTAHLFAAACSIPGADRPGPPGAGEGAPPLRPQARHLLPAGRRPARLHGHRGRGRQAGALRPARGRSSPCR